MNINFENLKNKPQLLLSLFGFIVVVLSIISMTLFYSSKSEAIVYNQIFQQLSSINKMKTGMVKLFFSSRMADIRALSSSDTIINLSLKLEELDEKYHIRNLTLDKIAQYEDVASTYSTYENSLKLFLKEYLYKDVLLADSKEGNIFFSVNYHQYIGKNLSSEEFKNSNMARVWKKVIDTKKAQISDMHTPFLYKDEPVMLLATPVFKDKKIISVLMLKLPSTTINEILNFRVIMQKSCKSYVVGENHLLRSDLEQELSVKKSFNQSENHQLISKNIDRALRGESGYGIIKDYRGVRVLSAYAPFQLDSFIWAIVTEIDEYEVYNALRELKESIYLLALFISVIVFFIGYFTIKKIIDVCVIQPLEMSHKKAKGFEDIINNSLNEIYIFTKEELYYIFANKSALANVGYSLEEIQRMKPFDIKPNIDEDRYHELIKPLIEGEKLTQMFETVHQRKDGTLYDAQIHLQFMDIGDDKKFVAIINDITEHKRVLKEKRYYFELASHDHLTKTFNRQMFDELFKIEVERSFRYGSALSMILLDIDNFKNVNDIFGHQGGDAVLVSLSLSIKTLLRDSDIFARWGGEEFIILMPHTTLHTAMEKAESLREAVEKLETPAAGSITCSFGVAQIKDFEHPKSLFAQADEALYKAKSNGRNRVETI